MKKKLTLLSFEQFSLGLNLESMWSGALASQQPFFLDTATRSSKGNFWLNLKSLKERL